MQQPLFQKKYKRSFRFEAFSERVIEPIANSSPGPLPPASAVPEKARETGADSHITGNIIRGKKSTKLHFLACLDTKNSSGPRGISVVSYLIRSYAMPASPDRVCEAARRS